MISEDRTDRTMCDRYEVGQIFMSFEDGRKRKIISVPILDDCGNIVSHSRTSQLYRGPGKVANLYEQEEIRQLLLNRYSEEYQRRKNEASAASVKLQGVKKATNTSRKPSTLGVYREAVSDCKIRKQRLKSDMQDEISRIRSQYACSISGINRCEKNLKMVEPIARMNVKDFALTKAMLKRAKRYRVNWKKTGLDSWRTLARDVEDQIRRLHGKALDRILQFQEIFGKTLIEIARGYDGDQNNNELSCAVNEVICVGDNYRDIGDDNDYPPRCETPSSDDEDVREEVEHVLNVYR